MSFARLRLELLLYPLHEWLFGLFDLHFVKGFVLGCDVVGILVVNMYKCSLDIS